MRTLLTCVRSMTRVVDICVCICRGKSEEINIAMKLDKSSARVVPERTQKRKRKIAKMSKQNWENV